MHLMLSNIFFKAPLHLLRSLGGCCLLFPADTPMMQEPDSIPEKLNNTCRQQCLILHLRTRPLDGNDLRVTHAKTVYFNAK